jgi:hypothetical protein
MMNPEDVVQEYFEKLIRTKQPDWSYFAKEPNFIMKKMYSMGAKYFSEYLGGQLLTLDEKKAKVIYAIENTKGGAYRFLCTLKKVDGEWKIKTFDNYDIG